LVPGGGIQKGVPPTPFCPGGCVEVGTASHRQQSNINNVFPHQSNPAAGTVDIRRQTESKYGNGREYFKKFELRSSKIEKGISANDWFAFKDRRFYALNYNWRFSKLKLKEFYLIENRNFRQKMLLVLHFIKFFLLITA
jgi:hypothetical protein